MVSDGFVLFDDLRPRKTRIEVRPTNPSDTLTVFAGNDAKFAHPIPFDRNEGGTFVFDLPRGKTYLIQTTDALGRLVTQQSIAVKQEAQHVDV